MPEQAELDLPPLPTEPSPVATRRRPGFAGLTKWQIVAVLLVIGALVWAMWITRTVVAKQEHIVSVRLSDLVGEYVEAQRYSASPPEKVKAEMTAFMAGLDKELQRRGAKGQIVLVGEAVLSKNVDDITDTVKAAVFAAGVPMPKRASAEQVQQMQQMAAQQAAAQAAAAQAAMAQAGMGAPGMGQPDMAQMAAPPAGAMPTMSDQAVAAPMPMPGAAVSTFGGPDGNGGQ